MFTKLCPTENCKCDELSPVNLIKEILNELYKLYINENVYHVSCTKNLGRYPVYTMY